VAPASGSAGLVGDLRVANLAMRQDLGYIRILGQSGPPRTAWAGADPSDGALATDMERENHRRSRPLALVSEDAPAYGILAAVRGLSAAGYEPWVAVNGPGTYARRSHSCAGAVTVCHPAAEPDAYCRQLAEAARSLGAAVVLPGTDRALATLSGKEHLFFPDTVLGMGPAEVVLRAMDKSQLAQVGSDVGLSVPPWVVLTEADLTAAEDVEYPAIVKPVRPAGTRGAGDSFSARRLESHSDLLDVIGSHPGQTWLVQPFISGVLEAACGVAWQGRVVCAAQQVADRIYPPDAGISAYARTVAPDPAVQRRVGALIEELGYSGIFQLQLLRTAAGRRYLIDMNLRPYGSLALTIAAGLNLPAIWADLLLGRSSAASARHIGSRERTYRVGVRYRSEERDAGALMTALVRGHWRRVVSGLVPRRGTVHAVFSLRDPLPLLSSVRQLRRAPRLLFEAVTRGEGRASGASAATEQAARETVLAP
jgi:predicted ATP-grasp superfamily ATP-dependent carboligase